jgi:DNA-binding transcriptional regulator YbjK
MAEQGVAAVTHRSVAARANLPPATTGYFFPTVRELLDATLQRFVGDRIAVLDSLTGAVVESGLGARDACNALADLLVSAPRPYQLALIEVYIEAARNPELRPMVERTFAAFEELAERLLRSAGAHRPRDGASAIVAMIGGFLLYRLARPRPRTDKKQLREALASLFLAYAIDDEERTRLESIYLT